MPGSHLSRGIIDKFEGIRLHADAPAKCCRVRTEQRTSYHGSNGVFAADGEVPDLSEHMVN